jgi:electron transfer flavoprotein alpha subunit
MGLVSDVLREQRPHILLFPATANGRDLAPRVAASWSSG